jgi:hypothetical protein
VKSQNTRAIIARVSLYVETSTTFTAKRQSLAARRRFRSLEGALFCRSEGAYRIATVFDRYGSVHLEIFIYQNIGANYGTPSRASAGVWNSAPDEQAARVLYECCGSIWFTASYLPI